MRTVLTFDDLNSAYVPSSILDQLLAFLEDEGIRGTLFAIPTSRSYQTAREDYARLLRRAKAMGNEIALHGYSHKKNEFGFAIPLPLPSLKAQKELLGMGKEYLQNLMGEPPIGFRAPFYRTNNLTAAALASMGFKYDSSKTVFKPAHGTNFRFRTRTSPRLTKIGSIVEIPVTGDYTYSLDDSCFQRRLRQAKRDFNWVKGLDGIFVMNNHLQRSGMLALKFLSALTAELRDETDFVRIMDLIY